jgi:hypothetical protein
VLFSNQKKNAQTLVMVAKTPIGLVIKDAFTSHSSHDIERDVDPATDSDHFSVD